MMYEISDLKVKQSEFNTLVRERAFDGHRGYSNAARDEKIEQLRTEITATVAELRQEGYSETLLAHPRPRSVEYTDGTREYCALYSVQTIFRVPVSDNQEPWMSGI